MADKGERVVQTGDAHGHVGADRLKHAIGVNGEGLIWRINDAGDVPGEAVKRAGRRDLLLKGAVTRTDVKLVSAGTIMRREADIIDTVVLHIGVAKVKDAHRSEEHTSELQSPCNLV